MIGHHSTTRFLTRKGLVMFVFTPTCLPISQVYILTLQLT